MLTPNVDSREAFPNDRTRTLSPDRTLGLHGVVSGDGTSSTKIQRFSVFAHAQPQPNRTIGLHRVVSTGGTWSTKSERVVVFGGSISQLPNYNR
ncbi:hypothetical protein CYMTET_9285 [Cymbomonas tetramitiformis]|uniref:Uncharacterized protein n=1 Tax=Cymbomonas tetramitiformis TaxID=36881 RepID=A0AAE0GRZ2_9CHLO|nr:hypothetical protein CYMTET_9285 [Cymbomonas tetramitiformis]